jgi:hypothetical protein
MDHANVTRQEIKGNAMLQEDWTAGPTALENALLGVEGQRQ